MGNKTKGITNNNNGTITVPTTSAPNNAPAQLVVSAPTTPVIRKGTSSTPKPVAQVWVTCYNLCFTTGGVPVTPTPTRKVLMGAVMGKGVTFYTARTQVQAFLRATSGGTVPPTVLPKHVVIS
jgi:hypothetical protein